MRTSEYIRTTMSRTAEEIVAVATAKGIPLTTDHITGVFTAMDRQAYGTTASTQRDLMEGKPSELETFNGYIVREGKRLGVATPINEFIYELLLPAERQARS